MSSISNIKSDIKEISNLKDIAEILLAVSSVSYMNLSKFKERKQPFIAALDRAYAQLRQSISLDAGASRTAIFIGSDLVFCGNFNRLTKESYQVAISENTYQKVILIGKQVRFLDDKAEYSPFPVTKRFDDESLTEKKQEFSESILSMISSDSVDIFYNFLNPRKKVETMRLEMLMPEAAKHRVQRNIQGFDETIGEIIADPNVDLLLEKFVSFYNSNALTNALLESETAENFLRMSTMNTAKDEAEKQIKTLNKTMNRMRQAKITKEITEIINSFKNL